MAWDDWLTDGVDVIDAVRWNSMITDQAGKSVTSHGHDEFQIYKNADYWYVYKIDSTHYAKNMSTGMVDYSGASFSTIMTSIITAIPYSGFIKLGTGLFLIDGAITSGDKPIIVDGMGWGRGSPLTNNPGTILKSAAGGDCVYLLQFGLHGYTTEGAGIRNCAFQNDPANTKCLGAVDLYNTVNSFVDHCYFRGFELAASGPMSAISIRGATDETVGGWCNRATNNHIVNPDIGILLGANANYCVIEGNNIEASGTANAQGIKCDGTGAAITSPYGCSFINNRIYNFSHSGPSRGIWVTAGCNNSGRHTFINNIFNTCYINFEITGGTGIGECTVIGNIFGTATSSKALDSGNVKSYYYNNKNYLTDNWGASEGTGAQQTIAHGLGAIPTNVSLTQTAATTSVLYLSAASDSTNIYVTCSSLRTYQWRASL